MCDALFTQVNKVHTKFTPSALRLNEWFLHPDRITMHPDGYPWTRMGAIRTWTDQMSITVVLFDDLIGFSK